MENTETMSKIEEDFKKSQKVLTALGDPNRQHLLIEMVRLGGKKGVRVGELTKRTYLSRPAVSHHLSILKDAGIVAVRKEGTKNYYHFDLESTGIAELIALLEETCEFVQKEGGK